MNQTIKNNVLKRLRKVFFFYLTLLANIFLLQFAFIEKLIAPVT